MPSSISWISNESLLLSTDKVIRNIEVCDMIEEVGVSKRSRLPDYHPQSLIHMLLWGMLLMLIIINCREIRYGSIYPI